MKLHICEEEKKKLPVVKYEVGTRMWPGGDCKAFQRA